MLQIKLAFRGGEISINNDHQQFGHKNVIGQELTRNFC